MAPEMVAILGQSRHKRIGYTNTVDWWSLGATIYELFTNVKPFAEFSMKKVLEVCGRPACNNISISLSLVNTSRCILFILVLHWVINILRFVQNSTVMLNLQQNMQFYFKTYLSITIFVQWQWISSNSC